MTGIADLPDGTYTAVVDSIEDGLATVFFEEDEEEIGYDVCETSELPEEGTHSDAILMVTIVNGSALRWTHDPERALERKDAAQERFDQLSERPPSDEDS